MGITSKNQKASLYKGSNIERAASEINANTDIFHLDLPELDAANKDRPNVDANENVIFDYEKQLNDRSDEAGEEISTEIDPPDGGWGWVVTFGAFVVNLIVDGIVYSFGLFFKELYVYFDESKSLTAWIGSALAGCILISGPIASALISIFGFRPVAMVGAGLSALGIFLSTWSPNVQTMILLFGVAGGCGLGQIYLTSTVTIGHYFQQRRALATGIALGGSGVGVLTFAPLSEFLINQYSWKGAMWIIAAITFNGVAMGALFRPVKLSQKTTREECKQKKRSDSEDYDNDATVEAKTSVACASIFDFSVLKSISFVLYAICCCLCMLGLLTPFTFLPDHATDVGMTSQESVYFVMVMSIFSSVGRVGSGWIADRPWSDTIIINSVTLMIGGLATVFVPFYKSFGVIVVYCIIIGISLGVYVALLSIIAVELVGIKKLNSSYGIVFMSMGIAGFIGSPIAGALADVTGNYQASFYYAGAALFLSGAICFPLRRISKWESQRKIYINGNATNVIDEPPHIVVKCISYNNIKEEGANSA